MKFREFYDPFRFDQPEMTFTKKLSTPLHTEKPPRWNETPASEDELDLSNINLNIEFKDPILDTAYKDFEVFLSVMQINVCNNGVLFTIKHGDTECFEAYKITVTKSSCKIVANDTEGIRRALVFVEDEMQRREGARLPIGEIKRKPHITARISRCYFSPASHVAIEENENELIDDIDYYPDEYLNRLAHDGINALWLGATMQHLVKSDIVPEYGATAEKRMAKLNSVIEKCKRYGIKTYLFAVDPASAYKNEKLLKNHPDMVGDEANNWISHLCPSTEKGLAYIKEAVTKIFTQAPGLAGFINLTVGEAESHCASTCKLFCKRCQKKFGSLGKTLSFVEKTISDTMKEVAPHAEYISWTYAQREWKPEDIEDNCLSRDKSVRQLVNFEDLGIEKQLGEDRLAYDYWLSYVGPGQLFKDCLKYNKEAGIETWAKIQVCSSHEISTIPYVPAPALLYEKYKFMYENSIHGVMQCWFFGNYPCLMNKAAGELAFEPFFPTKEEFLHHLAGIYWGKDADKAAQAWASFTDGYRNFPIGVDFEWFSTMQDSPAAPYHLNPIDMPLPSTWSLDNMVGGDRVCDCILNSHTLDEVITLTGTLSEKWDEGRDILNSIGNFSTETRKEQLSVAVAASYIFRSGVNTFKFYDLRNKLALGKGNGFKILEEMKKIVLEEIEISHALIPICEADNRIGYHSEAHGYKFFPKKLRWRIDKMEKLIETEFKEVKERLDRGEKPIPFYYGKEEGSRVYNIDKTDIDNAEWMNFIDDNGNETDKTRIKVAKGEGTYTLKIELSEIGDTVRIDPEFKFFHLVSPIILSNGNFTIPHSCSYSFFGERAERIRKNFECIHQENGGKEYYTLTFGMAALEMSENAHFRLMIKRSGKRNDCFAPQDRIYTRLVLGHFSPDAFGFFIPSV